MSLFRHLHGAFEIKSMPGNARAMEFSVLQDDTTRLLLSEPITHPDEEDGDFEFHYAIKAFDMAEYVGAEEVGKESPLHIELYVVAPDQVPRKERRAALKSWGLDTTENDAMMCEVLLSYGASACIYSLIGGTPRECNKGYWEEPEGVDLGDELDQGVELMRRHAVFVETMFGFYMDARINAYGATSWDRVKGDITGEQREAGT